MISRLKNISPVGLLWLLLGLWWALNLVQAAFTGLANDEAYYYTFSLAPAWGYFDHPPVTAWLVWLGRELFGNGEFGIRFFFTVLQPAYLLILYHLIRPAAATRRDVVVFTVVAAALPIMQLYGFLAVPDGPLLIASALFLWSFKRFTEKNTLFSALVMGAAVALLGYCKYHGALVVFFAVAANPRLLKNPKLYLAGLLAAALMLPHFIWQYNHDWISLRYHLSGRNKPFSIGNITEYLLNLLAVFNPLFWPVYVQAWKRVKSKNATERALYCICAGFILFFLLSSVRGYVQPQWVIVSSFGFIVLMMNYLRKHERSRRFVLRAGYVTLALVVLFRIEMIFNPLGVKYEVFDNEASYGAIHEVAAGRPVIFAGRYTYASKYSYYTGGEVWCQGGLGYRSSQWEFIDSDTPMAGREVLVQVYGEAGADSVLVLANGKRFAYRVVKKFVPVRRVGVRTLSPLPEKVRPGEEIRMSLEITNPYPWDLCLEPGGKTELLMVWEREPSHQFEEFEVREAFGAIGAESLKNLGVRFKVPNQIVPGAYKVGFAVKRPVSGYWFAGPVKRIKVLEPRAE